MYVLVFPRSLYSNPQKYHSWQRVPNPLPLFWKTPYIAYPPPFLNFVQSPLALPLFVALLLLAVCVFMQYLTCYYTTSFCCVFYATRYKIY